jgi:hypothetical protein
MCANCNVLLGFFMMSFIYGCCIQFFELVNADQIIIIEYEAWTNYSGRSMNQAADEFIKYWSLNINLQAADEFIKYWSLNINLPNADIKAAELTKNQQITIVRRRVPIINQAIQEGVHGLHWAMHLISPNPKASHFITDCKVKVMLHKLRHENHSGPRNQPMSQLSPYCHDFYCVL